MIFSKDWMPIGNSFMLAKVQFFGDASGLVLNEKVET
jgi:hypothetical protein